MIPVRSSVIEAIGYDPATRRMKIKFKQGRTYDFCGVPPDVYQELMSAGSIGSYYDRAIRDRYQC
ncbi:KTSC domain-containing protein [Pseudomonas citronellolis]|uniref:KTSC domain-containing protein n=1 Tax=Pseudomonas citronellolis TaxID=53408 RepID=UPI0022B43D6F|nr:KTSC domain-containing protein [Pseudomonas citronellolis]